MIADGKELIALISEIRSQYNCFDNADQKYYEALSLVIRILKHLPSEQPCDDAVSRAGAIDAVSRGCQEFRGIFAECEKNLNELPAVQTCEDAISRKAAIDAVSNWLYDRDDGRSVDQLLSTLPSVQPETHDKRTETHACDCISRQAAIDELDKGAWGAEWDKALAQAMIESLPSAQPQTEWNSHTVACLLAELFGDACACNYNGIDEWLPEKCEVIDACPNPVGVACWEQFLKHRAERRADV